MRAVDRPSGDNGGPAVTPRAHPVRRVATVVLLLAVVVAVGAVVAVVAVPAAFGASTLSVLSGSMEPALPVGSVVVVRPRPVAEIGVGDVITFVDRAEPSGEARIVTHRVVAIEPGPAFRTRGDANPDPDPGLVAPADVQGVEWYAVPWLGLARDRLVTPGGLILAGGLVLLLVGAHLLLPRSAGPVAVRPARGRHAAPPRRTRP